MCVYAYKYIVYGYIVFVVVTVVCVSAGLLVLYIQKSKLRVFSFGLSLARPNRRMHKEGFACVRLACSLSISISTSLYFSVFFF